MPGYLHTEEQRRASSAYGCIVEIRDSKDKKLPAQYRSLVRSAASDILTNGLGQMLAFLLAKDKGEHKSEHWALYCHLATWQRRPPGSQADQYSAFGLLPWLAQASSDEYRQTTTEVIAYLNWLKRFAEAELPAGEK